MHLRILFTHSSIALQARSSPPLACRSCCYHFVPSTHTHTHTLLVFWLPHPSVCVLQLYSWPAKPGGPAGAGAGLPPGQPHTAHGLDQPHGGILWQHTHKPGTCRTWHVTAQGSTGQRSAAHISSLSVGVLHRAIPAGNSRNMTQGARLLLLPPLAHTAHHMLPDVPPPTQLCLCLRGI